MIAQEPRVGGEGPDITAPGNIVLHVHIIIHMGYGGMFDHLLHLLLSAPNRGRQPLSNINVSSCHLRSRHLHPHHVLQATPESRYRLYPDHTDPS